LVNKIIAKIFSFLRDKVLVLEGLFNINDISDTILVDGDNLIPSPVNFLCLNHLDIWGNSVLSTEFKASFGILNSSNQGSSDRFSLEDQWKLGNRMWLWGETKLHDGTVHVQKREVVGNLMTGTDCVNDQVQFAFLSSHGSIVS